MFTDHHAAILEILQAHPACGDDALASLLLEHESTGVPLSELAIQQELVSREALLQAVAKYLEWEYTDVLPDSDDNALRLQIPERLARRYQALPCKLADGVLHLCLVDPFNSITLDDLSRKLGRPLEVVVADPQAVKQLIQAWYGEAGADLSQVLGDLEGLSGAEEEKASGASDKLAEATPVIRFVDLVLHQAVREQASDIHFEPFEDRFQIRYRVDGALFDLPPPPMHLAVPVISRIKVLAHLNIAERRVPQDGRIQLDLEGRPVDLRVSTLPTQFGESVVLRVLDKTIVNLDLEELGMPEPVLEQTRQVLSQPHGIFLVTGPTGSGKTTTLYSGIRMLNKESVKILTAEDPVEYEIEGIVQLPVRPQIGLSFASALRSFLRQDPDILMVGEIRDLETARIAIQAAQTGHLVLSTLHTNDAVGAVVRLMDMGVEPYHIASSLIAVLAQRLVRKLCPECAEERRVPDHWRGLQGESLGDTALYGRGCQACHQSGYRGRMGLFEMLMVDDVTRELIVEGCSSKPMREHAVSQGMQLLRSAGMDAVRRRLTTPEEVMRYT